MPKKTEPEVNPVPDGFIRYRVVETVGTLDFADTDNSYHVIDGHVDLPVNHHFYVYVGTYLFEE